MVAGHYYIAGMENIGSFKKDRIKDALEMQRKAATNQAGAALDLRAERQQQQQQTEVKIWFINLLFAKLFAKLLR